MNRNEANQTEQIVITNSMDSRAAALDTESTDKTINNVRKVIKLAGGVSQEGLVNMFNFDGMDTIKALKELLDNSTDWRRPHIILNINFIVNLDGDLIYCDNGQGMTLKQLDRAFRLFNENTDVGGNRSGKCGYGFKSALHKLCNGGKHTIITSTDGVTYLTQETIWSDVKVMENSFPIYDSDDTEIQEFKKYVSNSGTLIKIELTPEIKDVLVNQFSDDVICENIKDYLRFAYARIPDINISYKDKAQDTKNINFYNPYGLGKDDCLFGMDGRQTTQIVIKQYPSGVELIYWYDNIRKSYGYFIKRNKNINKTPSFCKDEGDLPPPNAMDSTEPEIIYLEFTTVCLKPRDDYYNVKDPKIPENTGLAFVNDYKQRFFGTNIITDFNNTMTVNRNGINIGLVPVGKRAMACSKGSAKIKFKKIHIDKYLSFQSTSDHNDNTDKYMCINKTKHNYVLPGNCEMLRRVCEYLAEEHGDYLWEMIEQLVAENEQSEETNASEDDNEGGVEESKGGDDDENGKQATAVQHNTVIPLHVSVGNGQRTLPQESDEESSDEANSVTEDVSDNNNVTDRNITATICDKAEQIYTDSTNIDNLTQEDDEEINKLIDKIIAIHSKYKH